MRLLLHDQVTQYKDFHIGDTLSFFSGSDEARYHIDQCGKGLLATQPTVCKELNFLYNPVSLGLHLFPANPSDKITTLLNTQIASS